MRRYSEAVRADVRRRMSPLHRQSVARISEELGIHAITLYKWRETWRLQGEVVPALADQKPFMVSESSFYRVLHQAGHCQRRGRAKPGLELGHHLSAHHGAGCVAVPLPGSRCVEPQGGGLGCRRGSVGPDRR